MHKKDFLKIEKLIWKRLNLAVKFAIADRDLANLLYDNEIEIELVHGFGGKKIVSSFAQKSPLSQAADIIAAIERTLGKKYFINIQKTPMATVKDLKDECESIYEVIAESEDKN